MINSLDCPVSLIVGNKTLTVQSHKHSPEQQLPVAKNTTITITSPANCNKLSRTRFEYPLVLKEKQWYNFVVGNVENQIAGHMVKQNVTLPPPGKAKLCTVLLPLSADDKTFDILLDKDRIHKNISVLGESVCTDISADHYKLTVQGRNSSKVYVSSDLVLKNGGIYTAVVQRRKKIKGPPAEVSLYEDLEAKSVSMLYQIPQYFVITSGEILFSITGEYMYMYNCKNFCTINNIDIRNHNFKKFKIVRTTIHNTLSRFVV